jgi:hypothetical protein
MAKSRRHPTWAFDICLGPRDFESEVIGRASIDRAKLASASVVALVGYSVSDAKLDQLQKRRLAGSRLSLKRNLPDALERLCRALVLWEKDVCRLRRPEDFLDWIERHPWDQLLLAVPSVQQQIDRVRRECSGKDLRRLGSWIQGSLGRGHRVTVNEERIRSLVHMTRRHLGSLSRTFRHELKDQKEDDRSARQAWLKAGQQHKSIFSRLRHAGLLKADPPSLRSMKTTLAYEIVAVEEGSTPASVAGIWKKRGTHKVVSQIAI